MKKINIAIKTPNKLTKILCDKYEIKQYTKPTFLSSLFKKNQFVPDINFIQPPLDKEYIKFLEFSKINIVNSNGLKEYILEKYPTTNPSSIKVVYPYISSENKYDEQIKQNFRNRYSLKENEIIIFISSSNLTQNGIQSFLKTISELEEKNFKVMIESTKKQIDSLKLLINRLKITFQIILLEDYENKDELFIASDIFLFPTKQKAFTSQILKAMYFQNIVFIPQTNYTSEIVDSFSIMSSPQDPSTSFKIDALLSNLNELKQIQKLNGEASLRFSIESRNHIIDSILDSLN